MDTHELGQRAEALAVNYLEKNGYQIIARNFRKGRAEVDIIAKNKRFLLFIEVKYRKKKDYGNPEDTLSAAQASRIHRVATLYQEEEPHGALGSYLLRFDIISISGSLESPEILHLQDAF